MYTCANCTVLSCEHHTREGMPKNCPMQDEQKMDQIHESYMKPQINDFYINASAMEAEGYLQWPRLRETVELCKRMGYQRIGLAFCGGLRQEAKVVEAIFRKHGLHLISVVCKVGSYDKTTVGMKDGEKIHPGNFEPMCNPITQAELLNEQKTEFNIVLGLCVGHDSLFLKHSDAMCTVLVAKDRALGNNPCAAIYTANTYCRTKL